MKQSCSKTKEGSLMLFNYNTLEVNLDSSTKSLHIFLNRDNNDQTLNNEMLFELESIFSWATGHIEISSILLSSTTDYFCQGLDPQELKSLSLEKLSKNLRRFQKLIQGMLHLPQTIICDLKQGARGIGIELSLGADTRIARENTSLNFDFLSNGFVPSCGGIEILEHLVGQGKARSWTLLGKNVLADELLLSGLISEAYSPDNQHKLTEKILTIISHQSPIARIQTKRSLLESILPHLNRAIDYNFQFSNSALSIGDWKRAHLDEDSGNKFVEAREISRVIKQS